MLEALRIKYYSAIDRLKTNSCAILIWLLDFFPIMGGFPLQTNKINALFMIIHVSLQFYAFIVGTIAYLMYVADGFFESVVSFFNVSIFGVVINNTLWFICKKKDLKQLLDLAMINDDLLIKSGRFVDNYVKLLRRIKILVIISYVFHFINDILIYIPSRIFFMDNFAVVSCVGLDLNSSPSHEICMFLLASQEVTAVVVVGAYDAIVLFIFMHTTAIFQTLYQDMDSFTEISKQDNTHVKSQLASERIKNIVIRHSALLKTVGSMQNIYTIAIGCGFMQNGVSLCLFFVLPIEISVNFGPLIYYTLFVFFLYCYYGQSLTNASERFEMAVYASGWESLNIKEQKSILLILKQAQKPVVLKAGGIVPISIYTFATAMQSIYKFVTVFKL